MSIYDEILINVHLILETFNQKMQWGRVYQCTMYVSFRGLNASISGLTITIKTIFYLHEKIKFMIVFILDTKKIRTLALIYMNKRCK